MERGQAARVAMGRSGYKSPRPAFLKYSQNFKLTEPFLGAAPYKGSIIGVTPGRRDESADPRYSYRLVLFIYTGLGTFLDTSSYKE